MLVMWILPFCFSWSSYLGTVKCCFLLLPQWILCWSVYCWGANWNLLIFTCCGARWFNYITRVNRLVSSGNSLWPSFHVDVGCGWWNWWVFLALVSSSVVFMGEICYAVFMLSLMVTVGSVENFHPSEGMLVKSKGVWKLTSMSCSLIECGFSALMKCLKFFIHNSMSSATVRSMCARWWANL